MAETVNNGATRPGIEKSWTLLAFASEFGRMKVGKAVNQETGKEFDSTVFKKPDGSKTYVSFSSNLGVLKADEIARRKNELQVVKLKSGNYKLCIQGEDFTEDWDSVDL